MYHKNTALCPITVNSNGIELIMHTFCYCILDLLCVTIFSSRQKILPRLAPLQLGKKVSVECTHEAYKSLR